MPETIETGGVLEIRDRVTLPTRVIFALLSLFPLLAPYELLILPKWEHRLHPFFLLCAFISIGAMALSGLLIWAAIAGLNTRMRFDRPRGTFTCMWDAPIVALRTHECSIRSVRSVEIETHDWSDSAPSYSLMVRLENGREFKSGSSWSREEIEGIKARVSAFLSQPETGDRR
jgi:hypothetical protein